MSKYDDFFDFLENDEEELELYMDKPSAHGRKFKARRKIEEMRENKRLQRQLDSYYLD